MGNVLLLHLYLGRTVVTGVLNLVISFFCWFRVIRVLFSAFWESL